MGEPSEATKIAEDYYDSEDADNFYAAIWGGEDIHIGLYDEEGPSIAEASRRTVRHMADRLEGLKPGARVLDIGAGYGGAARVLARDYGAEVVCLNLSTVENARNRAMNAEQGLAGRIRVVDGSFDDIPSPDDAFDIVWSQDAILHAPDRERVLDEVARVLRKGGEFIFTDPMQADDLSDAAALQPIYDRIHLENLASFGFYERELAARGFEKVEIEDLTAQLRRHYASVRAELMARRDELKDKISDDYAARMADGLRHWVDGADKGLLAWGVLRFRR